MEDTRYPAFDGDVLKAAPEPLTVTDVMHTMEMSISNLHKAVIELRERLDNVLREREQDVIDAEYPVPPAACLIANSLVGYDREIGKIYSIVADLNHRLAL